MKTKLKQFAESKYFDWFGVALVVGIAIMSGYLKTQLSTYVDAWWAVYVPLGLISVINVGFSMVSTRLTGRISNLGNVFGIVNVALSGAIDYILGNKAAIITYPVTFVIYTCAIASWEHSIEGKAKTTSKSNLAIIMVVTTIFAFVFSYYTNKLGYGGQMNTLAYVTTVAFALSIVANVLNAFKLTNQYHFWFVYNLVQLAKAFVQGNFANVGKYIFYIINAIGALFIWNDSTEKAEEA